MSSQRSQNETRHYVSPPNEQRWPSSETAAPIVARNAKGQPATAEDARRLAQRPRRSRYLPRAIACHADFKEHNARRVVWTRTRLRELAGMAGGQVSHAVGAMIAAAGWLYAGGEWACERAATTGDLDLFKTASNLTATARTHDFGAYELAMREAAARKQGKPAGLPIWIDEVES
jgi:hypothetical protein